MLKSKAVYVFVFCILILGILLFLYKPIFNRESDNADSAKQSDVRVICDYISKHCTSSREALFVVSITDLVDNKEVRDCAESHLQDFPLLQEYVRNGVVSYHPDDAEIKYEQWAWDFSRESFTTMFFELANINQRQIRVLASSSMSSEWPGEIATRVSVIVTVPQFLATINAYSLLDNIPIDEGILDDADKSESWYWTLLAFLVANGEVEDTELLDAITDESIHLRHALAAVQSLAYYIIYKSESLLDIIQEKILTMKWNDKDVTALIIAARLVMSYGEVEDSRDLLNNISREKQLMLAVYLPVEITVIMGDDEEILSKAKEALNASHEILRKGYVKRAAMEKVCDRLDIDLVAVVEQAENLFDYVDLAIEAEDLQILKEKYAGKEEKWDLFFAVQNMSDKP